MLWGASRTSPPDCSSWANPLPECRAVGEQGATCGTWPRPLSSGAVPLDAFDDTWDDAAIVPSLTSIKGIGVWTAEMFLIFALNRPDVLPAHDLGVRAAIRDRHALPALPRPAECHADCRDLETLSHHCELVHLGGADMSIGE